MDPIDSFIARCEAHAGCPFAEIPDATSAHGWSWLEEHGRTRLLCRSVIGADGAARIDAYAIEQRGDLEQQRRTAERDAQIAAEHRRAGANTVLHLHWETCTYAGFRRVARGGPFTVHIGNEGWSGDARFGDDGGLQWAGNASNIHDAAQDARAWVERIARHIDPTAVVVDHATPESRECTLGMGGEPADSVAQIVAAAAARLRFRASKDDIAATQPLIEREQRSNP